MHEDENIRRDCHLMSRIIGESALERRLATQLLAVRYPSDLNYFFRSIHLNYFVSTNPYENYLISLSRSFLTQNSSG